MHDGEPRGRALPEPIVDGPGRTVWRGGVEVLGALLVIHGRTLAADQVDEAEQHGRAVLAAAARLRAADLAPPAAASP